MVKARIILTVAWDKSKMDLKPTKVTFSTQCFLFALVISVLHVCNARELTMKHLETSASRPEVNNILLCEVDVKYGPVHCT